MSNNQISKYPTTFYRVSLKAIIRNDRGEILMAKEGGQTDWSLPGGGWDHGESAIDCLKRELFEEVGYTGKIDIKPIATNFDPVYISSKQAWLIWIVYEVQTENTRFSVGEDADEIAFVDPHTLQHGDSWEPKMTYRILSENGLLLNL